MDIKITIEGELADGRVFLGWTPRRVTIELTNIPAGSGSLELKITSTADNLLFTQKREIPGKPSFSLSLDPTNPKAEFFVAFEFFESEDKKPRQGELTATVIGGISPRSTARVLTARLRRNANLLTEDERDRFLDSLAYLNATAQGPFTAIRLMHSDNSVWLGKALNQAHHWANPYNVHFLPWHRAYLLSLERLLQEYDPSVTLPYWKFDAPAPKIFTTDFMGINGSSSSIRVNFSPSNPLFYWTIDGKQGVDRVMSFAPNASPKPGIDPQDIVLDYSKPSFRYSGTTVYSGFTRIESNSHNMVHVHTGGVVGVLSDPATAPQDPIFFLLHNNVDRLWARWQDVRERYDKTSELSYFPLGKSANVNDVGRYSQDTMWPWDGVTGGARPPVAPGAGFPASPWLSAPGNAPTIEAMLDYQGYLNPEDELGFDYDDVPFWR